MFRYLIPNGDRIQLCRTLRLSSLCLGLAGAVLSAQTPAQRAEALLKQMTVDEKIGQMNQLFMFGEPKDFEAGIAKGGYGSFLFVTEPAMMNQMQKIAVEKSRLHIPLIFAFDVIHGYRTMFPVPLAMAASWDPALAEKAQSIAAKEARAAGIAWTFAPMVDIARDPRWGRIVEGSGEDPYLGSAMAAAQVRGFQGPAIGTPDRLVACMKHFAGYGAAEGGRDYEASNISDTQLWNVYFPPFHAAVKAGVGSTMCAYMDLNDVPATGNRWLLQDVLRTTWGFKGFVVSDAMSVRSLQNHGFAADEADAAVRAFQAGVNMEMAVGYTAYSKQLGQALKEGRITEAQLDATVKPLLEIKYRMGLFDQPYVDEARAKAVLADPTHRTASREAAERCAVLLRNEGGLLPLKKGQYKRIAVLGELADSQRDTNGSWTFNEDRQETVTVLAGLKAKLGDGVKLDFAPAYQLLRNNPSPIDWEDRTKSPKPWTEAEIKGAFDKALALAETSDLTVLVLGDRQSMSGEAASCSTLALPANQQALLEAVVAKGKPVVLVLMNGRPLDISWAAQKVPAILDVWYPGTHGGHAVANLLMGDAAPGGKLPFTWPRNVGQVPMHYAQNLSQDAENKAVRYWNEASTPLFPFGYGLSYSTFSIENLKLSAPEIRVGEKLQVSVDVANTGSVTADEVPQLYIQQTSGRASRPMRELKGFQRVTLKPGEKKTVIFTLGPDELTYWSGTERAWIQDPTRFQVWVGKDCTTTLKGEFRVLK
jgi:beta-glucosidase